MTPLRQQINRTLRSQGYVVSRGEFSLASNARTQLRNVHAFAKQERIANQKTFIRKHASFIQELMIEGRDLKVERISPTLKLVQAGSPEEIIFRWWNYVWWSVPFERPIGRQMRYVVWDNYHQAALGLISLQSPILSWAPRDQHLGIVASKKDYWINQSMNAQRLGALPPYNDILGGKLVAMLMTCDTVRNDFRKKYLHKTTVLCNRELPARLLFITTTGAFGKSSVYTRLKFEEEWLAKFIGYSGGFGGFHISNAVYEQMLEMLKEHGVNITRGYGNGPSRKMRLVRKGMALLGYPNGNFHGVKRAIYLFAFAKNLDKLIAGQHQRPRWHHRQQNELTNFWLHRWALPRLDARAERLQNFNKTQFMSEQLKEIEQI